VNKKDVNSKLMQFERRLNMESDDSKQVFEFKIIELLRDRIDLVCVSVRVRVNRSDVDLIGIGS
jgi:hypothetical protein